MIHTIRKQGHHLPHAGVTLSGNYSVRHVRTYRTSCTSTSACRGGWGCLWGRTGRRRTRSCRRRRRSRWNLQCCSLQNQDYTISSRPERAKMVPSSVADEPGCFSSLRHCGHLADIAQKLSLSSFVLGHFLTELTSIFSVKIDQWPENDRKQTASWQGVTPTAVVVSPHLCSTVSVAQARDQIYRILSGLAAARRDEAKHQTL